MIANQLPTTMLDEAANQARVAGWLRRGDVLPAFPLNALEVTKILRAIQYDATEKRANRFC